jgi:hypothetical protein
MASQETQPTRGQRAAQRAAVAIAAGCCVLALAWLPTAQAAKNAATSSPTASGEAVAALHGKRAERSVQVERSAPAPVAPPGLPPPAEQPVAGHGKHARTTGSKQGPPAPAAGHGPATVPVAALGKLDREKPNAHGRRHGESARRSETTGAQSQAATGSVSVSGAESTQGAQTLARKQNKGGGQKKSTAPTPISTTGGSKGKQASIVSPQLATTDPSADSSSTPSAAVGTGSASISSVAPSNAATVGAAGVRAGRASHKPRRRTGAGATGVAALAPATRAAPLVEAVTNGARPSVARKAVKRAHPSAAQPAIVKTFTRIVGVVPTPVRILIAALIALALAFAVRSRVSGGRARRLMRQRGQLLEDVGLLQAALLPDPPPRLGPVGASVAYRPADGPGAGGDFYDVFGLDDGRIAVIVGDVSGHGREALPHTALVRFTVRAYLEAGLSPHEALQTAGSVLEHQLAGSFATVVAAVYHPRERTLTYASAGHPPPLVLGEAEAKDDATATALTLTTACSAPPLGAGMRTGTRETVVSVPGPAWLCFHTDGVTEARVGQDLFGSWRLSLALGQLGRDASATALLDSVAERTSARPDDMAACLLRVQDGAGAPTVAHELLELDAAMIAGGRAERFLRESGMSAAAATSVVVSARAELDRHDRALLELSLGDGPPRASLQHDNVIHTPTLTAVSAS